MNYKNCIEELKVAYNQSKKTASEFADFIKKSETVTLSQEEKRKKLKELLRLKYIFNVDRNLIKNILKEGEISDRLFMKFYSPTEYNGISKEIQYYKDVLKERDSFKKPLRSIIIDVNDVVTNPKAEYFSASQTDEQGYNIIDISKYLYGEKGKQNMTGYIEELVHFWRKYNNSHYFLSCPISKVGPRYVVIGNGSHILNTMQLLRNSGLSDSNLGLPKGFIESLKHVKFNVYDNSPDDVAFILLFNNVHRLFSKYNIKSEKFYIKDDSKIGKNVIGVEGKDISLSNCSELYNYANKIIEYSSMDPSNNNVQPQELSTNTDKTGNIIPVDKEIGE